MPVHVSRKNAFTVAGSGQSGSCRAEGTSGAAASACRTRRSATEVLKTSMFWGAADPAALLTGDFLNKGAAALWVFDQVLKVWQPTTTCLAAKPAP